MQKSTVEKVSVVITIDTECDHDSHWVRAKPLTYHSVVDAVPQLLQPAFQDVGAVPTYLLTVEVMENAACVNALRKLQGRHELGTHLHAAFIEPEKKFYDYAGVDSPDFQCFYSPEVEYKKLENLTQLFQQSFGYSPKSFRAGRFGAGIATLESLEKLGYLVDTSVTPHMHWTEPKGEVDYRRAPEQPYVPAKGSMLVKGDPHARHLLEVPVTTMRRHFRGPAWFRPWFSSVNQMKKVATHYLHRHRGQKEVVLNMMFHSMEVVPAASPYPQTVSEVERFIGDMHEVLSWCRSQGFEFCGLADLHPRFVATQGE